MIAAPHPRRVIRPSFRCRACVMARLGQDRAGSGNAEGRVAGADLGQLSSASYLYKRAAARIGARATGLPMVWSSTVSEVTGQETLDGPAAYIP
jgi:hypothetical protein